MKMEISKNSRQRNAFPRSVMFTSALEAERFQKAKLSGADICLIDLEDSVPGNKKALARTTCLETLRTGSRDCAAAVRINEIRSGQFLNDMLALIDCEITPEMILLPMIRNCDEVGIVRALFAESGKHPMIFALIETPDAVRKVDAIAAQSDGLVFGSADFAALLGAEISWENMLYPRQKIAIAAARYGIAAIDTPCYDLAGPDLLVRECMGSKNLGFHGKAAVHPSQVATIKQIFTRSKAEENRAIAILEANDRNGGAINKIDGQMIGPPFVKWANKILRENDRVHESMTADDLSPFDRAGLSV